LERLVVHHEEDVVSISHDLRGPLSVIGLEVTLLEHALPAQWTEARHSLRRITRNLAYLDHLLRDLLDLAAIDAARFTIELEPTELAGLVSQVVDRTVATRDRDRVTVQARSPIFVLADDRRIERVVANLVLNALKYAPRSSPIVVAVERADDSARVTVIDEGPGIAAEDVPQLFERFRRAPATRRTDGMGLGLYVSRKIVHAHGGCIGVNSVLGSGSQFYFVLPLMAGR
jgi:signal transduction histidine kinase